MPAFKSVFDDSQITAVLAYVRTLQGVQRTASITGNVGEGQALFFGKSRCAECHAVNGRGGFLAVDLYGYGKTHSADDLRQEILRHTEDGRYEWTKVITRSGKEYVGLIRNEDNFSLQLQTSNGDFLFFEKRQLAKTERQPRSIISANNSNEWKGEDLNNLIVYLSQSSAATSVSEQ